MNKVRFIIVLGFVLFIVGLSIVIAGPFGFFGRKTGDCANGSCSVQEQIIVPVEPTPSPVIVDNSILDNKPILSTVANNILEVDNDILASCDCKNCTCVKCVCDNCPGKEKIVIKKETLLPDPIDVSENDDNQPITTTYEYYERPRLFKRIFGRRR